MHLHVQSLVLLRMRRPHVKRHVLIACDGNRQATPGVRTDPLTERLAPLIRRCLARTLEDRVQTVRELREALGALHHPARWTPADAEAFWKCVEKTRFG